MKIGFIGLGQTGKPMALKVVTRSGVDVAVHSIDQGSYGEFRQAGARTVAQAQELADADLIFLSLPNSEVVRDVLLGSNGLIGHLKAGQTVVDTRSSASCSPRRSRCDSAACRSAWRTT